MLRLERESREKLDSRDKKKVWGSIFGNDFGEAAVVLNTIGKLESENKI